MGSRLLEKICVNVLWYLDGVEEGVRKGKNKCVWGHCRARSRRKNIYISFVKNEHFMDCCTCHSPLFSPRTWAWMECEAFTTPQRRPGGSSTCEHPQSTRTLPGSVHSECRTLPTSCLYEAHTWLRSESPVVMYDSLSRSACNRTACSSQQQPLASASP